jgi:hypothetical protein
VAACWLALWLTPVIALLIMFGAQNVFSQIAVFFSKIAPANALTRSARISPRSR